MARLGPLLKDLLQRLEAPHRAVPGRDRRALALRAGDEDGERMRLVVQFSRTRPRRGETWPEYRERVDRSLQGACDSLAAGQGRPLYLANALACSFRIEDIAALAARDDIETVELDPLVDPTLMDDAIEDVGLARFRERHGSLTGAGVRVAILDSGIDREHPALRVAESVSTCVEAAEFPACTAPTARGSSPRATQPFPGSRPT